MFLYGFHRSELTLIVFTIFNFSTFLVNDHFFELLCNFQELKSLFLMLGQVYILDYILVSQWNVNWNLA